MSAKTSKTHVNFSSDDGEMKERKKRYLTAKYGQHQMNLIKKRLKVELWMYEELQTLFQTVSYSLIWCIIIAAAPQQLAHKRRRRNNYGTKAAF